MKIHFLLETLGLTQMTPFHTTKIFIWCLKGSTSQIKNSPNQSFVASPPYDDFKISPQPICSSKSHNNDNYDKTTYKVHPFCKFFQANLSTKLFTIPRLT